MGIELPDGFLNAFTAINKELIDRHKETFGRVSEQLESLVGVVAQVDAMLLDFSKIQSFRLFPEDVTWSPIIDPEIFKDFQSSLERSLPTSWPSRQGNIEASMKIAEIHNIPLIDFPSKEIATRIFDAFESGEEIEPLLATMISQVAQEFLNRDKERIPLNNKHESVLEEVALCLLAGRFRAAQSLSFAALEDLWWQFGQKTPRNNAMTVLLDKSDYDDEPLYLLKWNLALISCLRAYQWIDFHKDGFPSHLHRHASAHSISEAQYVPSNALKVFVIAVSTASLCAQPGLALEDTKRNFLRRVLNIQD